MTDAPDPRQKLYVIAEKMMDRAAHAAEHGNDKLALEAIRQLGEVMKRFDPDDGKLGAEQILVEAQATLREVWADELHCPTCDGLLKPKKATPRKRAPRRSTPK